MATFGGTRPIRSMMRLGLAAAAVLTAPHAAHSFAGEDFLLGNPWHHEAISEDAMKAKGFLAAAYDEIAWHADYIDSYLYNPLFWIQGGLSRYKVAMASFDELAKLHFDDNFSGDHVRRTWRRYLSGAMAGLIWAAERNDVSAARNILGVSLHLNQDFYSHSSWVDSPDRRAKTWFEFPKAQRDLLAVYVGAYELPEQLGVKHHGKITPACSVLRMGALKPMLDAGCSAFSPLHNAKICDMYDECKTGTPITPSLLGIAVPNNVLYAAPPGMNLDARWSAGIGVKVRGLTDMTGNQAFDTARGLAQKSSEQWLGIVETKMNALGFGTFWNQVKTAANTGTKEQQYENFSKFPYQFLTAGTYPPKLSDPEAEYYLRVQINTANVANAGTDADIYLKAGGKSFLLDYMHQANPVLAYNDFERGDVQVYTVGPFSSLPSSISFYNDSATVGNIFASLAEDFKDSIVTLVDSIGSFLLSLVGGHADKVGGNKRTFSPAELAGISSAGTNFNLTVDGGDEGAYRISYTIKKVSQTTGNGSADTHTFSVKMNSLFCIRESKVDRLSSSDEPYLLALVVPLPGSVQKKLVPPFVDVDKDETHPINYTFPNVTVNKANGMLSVPIAIWESDDESSTSRTEQLNKFAGEAEAKTDDEERPFIDALGASIAADWKIGSLNVYAFRRGAVVQTGTVLNRSVNEWVEGKQTRNYSLNLAGMKAYPAVNSSSLDVVGPILNVPVQPGTILRPPGTIVRPPTGAIRPPSIASMPSLLWFW